MKLVRFFILTTMLVSFFATAPLAASTPSVIFLNPGSSDDAFFGMMTTFMQAAADDLGIDLDIIYCDRDHLKMREQGFLLLEQEELPEYLILINEKNGAADILFYAASKGVKVILINEGLLPNAQGLSKRPGKDVPNWLFEFLPDDRQAGRLLAKTLIDDALAKGLVDDQGKLNMVGISGSFHTASSSSRVQGLHEAIKEYDNVILHQVAPAYWEEEKATAIATGLLTRYPEISTIWSASDLMARGALKATQLSSSNEKTIITGGIDWADFAIRMVANGDFSATVGGHFMDGGWALVMLNDYHQGIPPHQQSYMSQFSVIDAANARLYLQLFGDQDWNSIDFRKFSKKHNPTLQDYQFGLQSVMDQLQSQ